MSAPVISLRSRRFDRSGTRERTEPPWSNQEIAEFYRIAELLGRAGMAVETDQGLSDEGDPWFVFLSPDNGDVLAHFARIDGVYVAATIHAESAHIGTSFRAIVHQIVETEPLIFPTARTGSNVTNLYLHPFVVLAALVATAFVYSHRTGASQVETADKVAAAGRVVGDHSERASGSLQSPLSANSELSGPNAPGQASAHAQPVFTQSLNLASALALVTAALVSSPDAAGRENPIPTDWPIDLHTQTKATSNAKDTQADVEATSIGKHQAISDAKARHNPESGAEDNKVSVGGNSAVLERAGDDRYADFRKDFDKGQSGTGEPGHLVSGHPSFFSMTGFGDIGKPKTIAKGDLPPANTGLTAEPTVVDQAEPGHRSNPEDAGASGHQGEASAEHDAVDDRTDTTANGNQAQAPSVPAASEKGAGVEDLEKSPGSSAIRVTFEMKPVFPIADPEAKEDSDNATLTNSADEPDSTGAPGTEDSETDAPSETLQLTEEDDTETVGFGPSESTTLEDANADFQLSADRQPIADTDITMSSRTLSVKDGESLVLEPGRDVIYFAGGTASIEGFTVGEDIVLVAPDIGDTPWSIDWNPDSGWIDITLIDGSSLALNNVQYAVDFA